MMNLFVRGYKSWPGLALHHYRKKFAIVGTAARQDGEFCALEIAELQPSGRKLLDFTVVSGERRRTERVRSVNFTVVMRED
jgi:hypothetical protein